MDYVQAKKLAIKYLEIAEEYLESFNWFYIGSGIFIILMLFYIYDSMVGSQQSPWLIVGIIVFLVVLGILSQTLMSGF